MTDAILKRVPPGAIGHNRGVVRPNYAVIAPEGPLLSRLPQYAGTAVRFLAAPSMGARFAQFILEMDANGGTTTPFTDDVQSFFYVLAGSATLTLDGHPRGFATRRLCLRPSRHTVLTSGAGNRTHAAETVAARARAERTSSLHGPA